MTEPGETALPHFELIPATPEQQPILANLLELYIHDFSEFLHLSPAEDGRFGYPPLPLYWSDPDRHPFLLYLDNSLAGFALVKRGSELSGHTEVWDVAEFFILRAYRNRGFGTQAAHMLWRHLPGRWEVRVMQANVSAQRFWARAIASFTGNAAHPIHLERDGKLWFLFSFDSKL